MYLHSRRTFKGSERKQSLSSSYPKYLYTICINVGGMYNLFIKYKMDKRNRDNWNMHRRREDLNIGVGGMGGRGKDQNIGGAKVGGGETFCWL